MQESRAVLEAVDEELSHISPTARWTLCPPAGPNINVEFKLVSVTHQVAGVGCVQCFWPLDDLLHIRRDIQASVKEQSGAQTIVFQYSAPKTPLNKRILIRKGSPRPFVTLNMKDGSIRTASRYVGPRSAYEIRHAFMYYQDEHPAVSAAMLEAMVRAGDLTRLKTTIRTANHLNMGIKDRPIHLAITCHKPDVLEWLVAQPGIDVNRLPMDSLRPVTSTLFRLTSTDSQVYGMRCLCTLLRAGLSLTDKDPETGFHVFHWLARTCDTRLIYVMNQEDIVQRLLEYASCAFEPGTAIMSSKTADGAKLGGITRQPTEAYKSKSPVFIHFLRCAKDALCLAVSAYMPVSALATLIVSYITLFTY